MSRRVEIAAGLILLAIGAVLLLSDWIVSLIRELPLEGRHLAYWPAALIVLSLFFLGPALFGVQHRRLRAGMAIPGAFLAVVGATVLYTSLSGRWEAWAYLWPAIPFSLGIGLYLAGWAADAPAFKWIGAGLGAAAVIAYVVLTGIFGGEAFRLIGGIAVLALGAALTIGGLAERLSRKSP
jgi:hypothetical protein